MDGVGTPVIGRPRPLPGHDTPNPANNTYTLKCEEPLYLFVTESTIRRGPSFSIPCMLNIQYLVGFC